MIVKDVVGGRGNMSVGYLFISVSWVGFFDIDFSLDRKFRMVLKVCGVVRGRVGA